jgi:hypothetical protein
VTALDIALNTGGVFGVVMMLVAYAGIHFDWFDPKKLAALLMNLVGSSLVLLSMIHAFNLSAFLMEASWAAMALYGLAKLVFRR